LVFVIAIPEILESLSADSIFHIYDQSSGNELLFASDKDYLEFLFKLKKYISSVATVYSYCLMPNHYHLIVRINAEKDLTEYFNNKALLGKIVTAANLPKLLSRQFSDFFNAYAKYYNYVQNRKGTLFRRAFRKKQVKGIAYLKTLICYVSWNPVDASIAAHCSE
jgi:putative transposase